MVSAYKIWKLRQRRAQRRRNLPMATRRVAA
ncbi:MAG: hypothetical protein RLZZ182_1852 [Pseudomonadota bacterium]|jgi:hypothetical protein